MEGNPGGFTQAILVALAIAVGLRTRAAECPEARARQRRRLRLPKSRAIPDQRARLAFVGPLRAAIGHAASRSERQPTLTRRLCAGFFTSPPSESTRATAARR
jgi:hypothetical protein